MASINILQEDKKRALIISVSNYENNLQPLDFCKKDGEEIYQLLTSLGYEIPDDFKLIGDVKWQTMRDSIIRFFTNPDIKAEDTLILYFSGHGIPDGYGDTYLATTDIDPDAPYDKGYSFNDLTGMVQRSVSTRIVIILDCCYSGGARLSLGPQDSAANLATAAIDKQSEKLLQGEGRFIIAASQATQEAYALAEGDHSIFTYYLLKGLKGDRKAVDENGNITPISLGRFIFSSIVNLPVGKKPKQKPLTKMAATGDIILVHYENQPTTVSHEKDKNHQLVRL